MTPPTVRPLTDHVSTIEDLARTVGTKRAANALLRKLGIPIHSGVFSRRLLLARLELRPGAQEDIFDSFSKRIATRGLFVVDAVRGRRTVVMLRATRDLRIGLPEFEIGEDSPYASVAVREGESIRARLYAVATRDKSGVAQFNVTGLEEPDTPPFFFLFIGSEERLLEVQRTELIDLRDTLEPTSELTPTFSRWRGDGIRLSVRKGRTDFDDDYRLGPLRLGAK